MGLLAHEVESRASLEPGNLALVEGVVQSDVLGSAIGLVQTQGEGLAFLEFSQAKNVDAVGGVNLVVVSGVSEGKGQHALLLQVGFVDTSKGLGDDSSTVQVTGFQSSMLTGRTFTVVFVTNDDPLDATLLVVTGNIGNASVFVGEDVADLISLT